MNDRKHLELVRELVESLGLTTREAAEQVLYLMSLWVEGRPKLPGARNFHLLYFSEARLVRSLDLQEVLRTLKLFLIQVVGSVTEDAAILPGFVVESDEQFAFFPVSYDTDEESLLEPWLKQGAKVPARSFLSVSKEGNIRMDGSPRLSKKITTVYFLGERVVETAPGIRRLGAAEMAARLFAYSVNRLKQPDTVLGAVTSLTLSCEGFEYWPIEHVPGAIV